MTDKTYLATVEYDIIWDFHYIDLPEEVIDAMGLEVNNIIEWIDNKDGSYTLKKKEKIDE
jgi:hypothetical protein